MSELLENNLPFLFPLLSSQVISEEAVRKRWPSLRSLCVSTYEPRCNMAFYSYVMVQNVHVGIEATLHVVGEQRGTTESLLNRRRTRRNRSG